MAGPVQLPLKDLSTGEFIGVIEYVRDVTAFKKTDEALRESEQKLRRIIEQAPDGIVLTDEKGVIIEWNPGMEKIVGLKREDVVGANCGMYNTESATEGAAADNRFRTGRVHDDRSVTDRAVTLVEPFVGTGVSAA